MGTVKTPELPLYQRSELFRHLSSYIHLTASLETIILIAMLNWQQLHILITWHSRTRAGKTVRGEETSALYGLCSASVPRGVELRRVTTKGREDVTSPPPQHATLTHCDKH